MDITVIPLDDAKEFLASNNYIVPSTKQKIYDDVDIILDNNDYITIPLSITDFLIAEKLLENNKIKTYKISDILYQNNLQSLAKMLLLPSVNKERIIRILSYLNKLDTSVFDVLPEEILRTILDELDCKSAFLFCKTNPKLKRFCNQNLLPSLQNNFAKQGLQVNTLTEAKFTCEIKNRGYPTMTNHYGYLYVLIDNKIYQIQLVENAKEEIIVNDTINVENVGEIVQIAFDYDTLYILNSQGLVYKYQDNQAVPINKINNIIYMIRNYNSLSFVDINGNLYDHKLKVQPNQYITDMKRLYILKNNKVYYIFNLMVPILTDIKAISSGNDHYLALSSDNQVYAWGKNDYGQLGLDDQNDYNLNPTLIPNLHNIVQVLAAKEISLFLTADGDVYHCGRNLEEIILSPTKLTNISNVVELYDMENYPDFPGLDKFDIEQLAYEDIKFNNYQIARTKDDQFLVLIGELLYPIKLF